MSPCIVFFSLACGLVRVSGEPRGHNQPFGAHTVPNNVPSVSEFPPPREFFEEYMLPGRPVVFKSILKMVNFPPYTLWNDEYLREKYGKIKVQVEKEKKESRDGVTKMESLREFLDTYKTDDVYMVQNLKTSMFGDMVIPRSIKCGGLQNFIESVVLWFSSGGTKSVIHIDGLENFNCILDGTKKLVLVDRKYKEQMEANGFHVDGFYSSIDVDRVDMHKYPRILEVETLETTLEPGDCMYIPYKWYHQVNSFGNRNLAVNIWIARIPWFNHTNCDHVNTEEQTSPFLDYGFITKENLDLWYLFNNLLVTPNVTTEHFLEALVKSDADDIDAILEYVDKNEDSIVTWEELLQVNAQDFLLRFLDSLNISPTFSDDVKDPTYDHEDGSAGKKSEKMVHGEL